MAINSEMLSPPELRIARDRTPQRKNFACPATIFRWFRNTFKRRPLLQTSSPASYEGSNFNSMARVSFKTVSPRGFTPVPSR